MAKYQDYKVVILGASGVGKSVFLGSYFYADMHRDDLPENVKMKYSLQQGERTDDETISTLINTLFEKRVGTQDRIPLDFEVPELKMNVHIEDVPGGWTTVQQAKEQYGINEDLLNADGVMIFMSAWDIVHEPTRIQSEILAHNRSIKCIRDTRQKNGRRPDVPIYFIFTKGDLVASENIDKEYLEKRVKKLLDQAQTGGNDWSDWIFPKGKYVRSFLCTALGKWLDANNPPKEGDYKPVNVVEPMEQLL